jgi:hypothetical protein
VNLLVGMPVASAAFIGALWLGRGFNERDIARYHELRHRFAQRRRRAAPAHVTG